MSSGKASSDPRGGAGASGTPAGAGQKQDPSASGSLPLELLKELRRLKIRTKHLANDELSGAYTSVFKGQGLSFREVRSYMPGDDVRWIDWNVSARMDDAFVKVFTEEREMTVMLVVDMSGSAEWGTARAPKLQIAAEVAALCAFSAIYNNDQVGMILATDIVEKLVPPKKGDKHVMRVIREILYHRPEYQGTNLKGALETLIKVTKRKSVAFLISDFFASGYEQALALAGAKHDVIPVMIVDPRDEELPNVGLAAFEDLETGEEVLVDTSSKSVRDAYRESMKALRADRDKLFKRLALDSVIVRTDQSVSAPIRNLFAKRARRRR